MERNSIFTQRVQYAVITTYRNYCNIDEKINWGEHKVTAITWDALNEVPHPFAKVSIPPKTIRGKKLKQIFYFTTENGAEIDLKKAPFGGVFLTTDQGHISKHMSNPFSQVELFLRENRIEKDGNVVKLVCDIYKKTKGFNSKWSKKQIHKVVIKFDFNNGNFMTLIKKDGKTKFRTNNLFSLKEIEFRHFFDFDFVRNHPNTNLKKSLNLQMSPKNLTRIFLNVCREMIHFGDTDTLDFHESLYRIAVENLVKNKNIKVPDNYGFLLANFYPTQKFLKKNENKLVQSCLDMMGIKTPITTKILHQNQFNIMYLVRFRELFGEGYERYVGSIRWDLIDKHFDDQIKKGINSLIPLDFHGINKYSISVNTEKPSFNTKKEKSNLLKIINDYLVNRTPKSGDVIKDLHDHKKMIDTIGKDGEHLTLNATTFRGFIREHAEYSRIERKLTRLYEIIRVYDEEFISKIDGVYFDGDRSFDIKILKNQFEFDMEGETMNHCVAGYIKKPNSLIISVKEREGDGCVTIEYSVFNGVELQCRSEYNKPPEDYMGKVLRHVSSLVSESTREMRTFKIFYEHKNGERTESIDNSLSDDLPLLDW